MKSAGFLIIAALLAATGCDSSADASGAGAHGDAVGVGSGEGSGAAAERGGQRGPGRQGGPSGGPGRGPRGPIPVIIESPIVGHIAVTLQYPGEINAEEVVEVAAELGARLDTVQVVLGQPVEAEQVLATLDEREARDQLAEARAQLAVTDAQVERAEVELENAQEEIERNRPLQQRGLVTESQFAAIEAQVDAARAAVGVAEAQEAAARAAVRSAETEVDRTEVKAPFGGRIAAVHVDPGAVVSPGAPLFRLVSADRLVLRLAVNENDAARVVLGQPARVRLTALPGEVIAGRVARVGAQIDPQSRALPIEITIEPGELQVLDGMSGTVEIEVASSDQALLVPQSALHQREDGTRGVWLHRAGRAVEQIVQVGLSDGERVEIVEGLAPEDQVIVRGQNLVREGAEIVVR